MLEDNIRMNPKEIGMIWVNMTQDGEYWSLCECGIGPSGSVVK